MGSGSDANGDQSVWDGGEVENCPGYLFADEKSSTICVLGFLAAKPQFVALFQNCLSKPGPPYLHQPHTASLPPTAKLRRASVMNYSPVLQARTPTRLQVMGWYDLTLTLTDATNSYAESSHPISNYPYRLSSNNGRIKPQTCMCYYWQ